MLEREKRLFLRLGDRVTHSSYEAWGVGVVVEVMTSTVPGGTCLVRILFEDGQQRTFVNDMDNEICCCYFGLRKHWRTEVFQDLHPGARPAPRRRLNGPR